MFILKDHDIEKLDLTDIAKQTSVQERMALSLERDVNQFWGPKILGNFWGGLRTTVQRRRVLRETVIGLKPGRMLCLRRVGF